MKMTPSTKEDLMFFGAVLAIIIILVILAVFLKVEV